MQKFRQLLILTVLVLGLAAPAYGQAIGQIFGKVTDSTGATLPGATVTVTGTGLQRPLVAATAASGAYTFPSVPIGTYTVTVELTGFKKVVRTGIAITTGFSAMIDAKLELGDLATEISVTAAAPVVDTTRTTTGGTFTRETLENVPTARDPWQIINMAPGVTLSGVNVGGSGSGQQLTPSVYGTSANVQWNIEGGNTTDMASNSSASYYNFDSFQEIRVVTGGGDVSVQSSGLHINLVTKSGSNMFKGAGTATFQNDAMQGQNVSKSLFDTAGTSGLSGNPIKSISNYSAEFGGPIMRDRLWFFGTIDRQDINVGINNFFDTSKSECNPPPTSYDQLGAIQKCLYQDKTLIKNISAKTNYQLNKGNKIQFLMTTDNKVRNARSASANTAPESTYQQFSPGGLFAYFTPQLTHTLILSDKLVITNQFTYVTGGFSLDFQDSVGACGQTKPGEVPGDQNCQYHIQRLRNRTSGYLSRGPGSVSYFERPTLEVKSEGTYFKSNFAGGDHQLKFGIGWHEARSLSYSHFGGGATNAYMQCVGNLAANCGAGTSVPLGSASGLVPYQAVLSRDSLSNVDWGSFYSYIQDSYTRGRIRINGGIRQDWQNSILLGGCVPANVVRPDLLPEQCQDKADPGLTFNNFSPRGSVNYDLFGNGRTAVRASGSYYYDSRLSLAGNLNNLGAVTLTWGSNQTSGACSTAANGSCWQDLNYDAVIQANELTGRPTANTARFDSETGILTNLIPVIDPDLQIGRTREVIAGIDHDLGRQMRIGFEYVYRYYDRGTRSYIIGYEPGAAGFPASKVYTDRQEYTDPVTGITAPYYTVCQGCTRATGTSMTATNVNYQTYKGMTVQLDKRYAAGWHAQGSFTYNLNRNFTPEGGYDSPTGLEFSNGARSGTRFVVKANGSVDLPWGLRSGANLQIQDGSARNRSVNGPGQVYGGTSGTINLGTLTFEENGTNYLPTLYLLDANLTKAIKLSASRELRLTFDVFNLMNAATVRGYSTNNLSEADFTEVDSIIPPRVFRVMARFVF